MGMPVPLKANNVHTHALFMLRHEIIISLFPCLIIRENDFKLSNKRFNLNFF